MCFGGLETEPIHSLISMWHLSILPQSQLATKNRSVTEQYYDLKSNNKLSKLEGQNYSPVLNLKPELYFMENTHS